MLLLLWALHDGEAAHYSMRGFGDSYINLQCFIHMKDNIPCKLSEFLLPERIRAEINNIFQLAFSSTLYVKGLLNSESISDIDIGIIYIYIYISLLLRNQMG